MIRKLFVKLQQRAFRTKTDVYKGINPLSATSWAPYIAEVIHIASPEEQEWFEAEIPKLAFPLPIAQQLNAYRFLQMTETFDDFLRKKYPFYKRFSGEGLESLTPLLYSICQEYKHNDSSIVFSLAHRGKIGILAALFNYPIRNLLWKIKGNSNIPAELNENRYYFADDIHFGVTCVRPELGNMKIIMTHNPAHLEIRGPIGMGKVKARQDRGENSLHVWVHGDGAIAAQGVVYESQTISNLPHFNTQGTIQIVANNQIGYTAKEEECRSSNYCTALYKAANCPIFHVDANSIDVVVKIAYMSVRYRNLFKKDFIIDLVGYRRFGHNELDEPEFTNPLMYKRISQLRRIADIYAEKIVNEGVATAEFVRNFKEGIEEHLEKEFKCSERGDLKTDEMGRIKIEWYNENWKGFELIHRETLKWTGCSNDKLEEISSVAGKVSEGFGLAQEVAERMTKRDEEMKRGIVGWEFAETLAIGSLIQEGFNLRISACESSLGSSLHRDLKLICSHTGMAEIPLNRLFPGNLAISNCLASNLATLGFDYGYSIDNPKNIVIHELGDFPSMPQAIIDTCIAGGESKWLRQSGLILLLQRELEGEGPDYSSSYLERFLTLVNDPLSPQLNLEVANTIHPSNYFHLLRRSVKRNFRRPLVIGIPKHKYCVSSITAFQESSEFQPVVFNKKGKGSSTLIVCSGKLYLDLVGHFSDISILLIEGLAPLPLTEIKSVIENHKGQVVWVQEEPKNQGIFNYIRPYLEEISAVTCISPPGSSVGGPGSLSAFQSQQASLFTKISSVLTN